MPRLAIFIAIVFMATFAVAEEPMCKNPPSQCEREIRQMLAGRRYHGVQFLDLRPGLYIDSVIVNSPGDMAGLRKGDRIMGINGKNFEDATARELKQEIATAPAGRLFMIVLRRSSLKKIEMRLTTFPKDQIDQIIATHLEQGHGIRVQASQ